MRLILDCNILISAGWNPGVGRQAFFEAIEKHQIFISPGIIQEYLRVIHYPKFRHIAPLLEMYCAKLIYVANLVHTVPCPYQLPDPSDEVYLATALAAGASVIITGNMKHYPDPSYGAVQILTPREFLALTNQTS